MMRAKEMFYRVISGRYAKGMVVTSLFAIAVLFATVAGAQPCTSPGEPVGCIEIDTPLDAQVWMLVSVAIVFSVGYLRIRTPKTLA